MEKKKGFRIFIAVWRKFDLCRKIKKYLSAWNNLQVLLV